MLTRTWRTWNAKARLLSSYSRLRRDSFFADELRYSELSALADSPELAPNAGMAEIWHEYSHGRHPDYSSFLQFMAQRRSLELRSILDLACGTGTLTEALTNIASDVIGLDASEPMLDQARNRCSSSSTVRFMQGDFRSFDLGRSFDAIVCAYNSLNYLTSAHELREVFECVAAHLRPGGLLAFDTFTRSGMQLISGRYLHTEVNGQRFAIHFEYDSRTQRERSTVLLPGGTEIHRRIPIDPEDVTKAAKQTSLHFDDYFSSAFFPGWWFVGPCCFFVLSKQD